jgi:hypothetical protein
MEVRSLKALQVTMPNIWVAILMIGVLHRSGIASQPQFKLNPQF